MVNSLRDHQIKVNGNNQGDVQSASVHPIVHSSHAGLSTYDHVTTHSVTQCSDGDDNQLFLCTLFDINFSTEQGLNRPQFYSEQEVVNF